MYIRLIKWFGSKNLCVCCMGMCRCLGDELVLSLRVLCMVSFGRYSSHTYFKIGNEYRMSNVCVNRHGSPFGFNCVSFVRLDVMRVMNGLYFIIHVWDV